MSDKNIDKDIEKCKELVEDEHIYYIGEENQKALGNVLSELENKDKKLEEYRKFHDRRLKEWNKRIENQEKHFLNELDEHDKELETWKKIAEIFVVEIDKLTEYLAQQCGIEDFEFCDHKCLVEDDYIDCKQCIIDWARKEVENDE